MLIPVILVPLLFIGVFLSCYAINFLYRQAETQAVSDNLRAKSVLPVKEIEIGRAHV